MTALSTGLARSTGVPGVVEWRTSPSLSRGRNPADMTSPAERPDRHRHHSRVAARAIALLVVAFLALLTAAGSLPAACGSCHAMRPYVSSWRSSPHSSVSCYSCHLPSGAWSWPAFKAREMLAMYPAGSLGATLTGPGTRAARPACLACHASVLDATIEGRGLRVAHASCAASTACDTCHTDTAHGTRTRWIRRPDMDSCVDCHLRRGATIACDACHAMRTQARRLKTTAWRATHDTGWATTHGRGEITLCRTCHSTGFCVGCHGIALPHPSDFARVHGGYSQVESARCAECHDRTAFCDGCHGVPMPHADGYLKSHNVTTKGVADPRCLLCHDRKACTACHKAHTHPKTTRGSMGSFDLPAMKP